MVIDGSEILIYDEIAGADDGYGYSTQRFAADLRELSGERHITLRINSNGGSLFAGLGIYDQIQAARRMGYDFVAYIEGAALSIASAFPLACNRVVMGSASVMMLHNPWAPGAGGNVDDLRRTIAALEKATERLIDIYQAKTGKSRAVIKNWLAAETWFSPREAVEAGLADEISSAMPRLAALCNLGEYRRIPARVLAEIRRPVDREIREVVRRCADVREAPSYDHAIAARYDATEAAERLSNVPGVTTKDLDLALFALGRVDVYANEHNWDW